MTTRAVAQAASVQAPTIYRLFGDKDGLVDAVAEHVMAAYVASTSDAAQGAEADPVADLRQAWHEHVRFGLANPELYTLLSARGRPSAATRAGTEVLRSRVRRLAAAGLLRVPEQRAVAMVRAAGNGTVLALLAMPDARRDPGLAGTMLDAVLSGVLTDAPATRDASVSAATIAFSTAVPRLPT